MDFQPKDSQSANLTYGQLRLKNSPLSKILNKIIASRSVSRQEKDPNLFYQEFEVKGNNDVLRSASRQDKDLKK